MGIKLSGIVSGFDTDSMVKELVKANQTKIDNVEKKKTKLEWKKEAWTSVNKKIYSFYTGALATFKSTGSYQTKKVTNPNTTAANVTANNSAVNGTHSLSVLSVAKAKMVTGAKINTNKITATSYQPVSAAGLDTVKLSDLTDKNGDSIMNSLKNSSFKLSDGTNEYNVDLSGLSEDSTVSDLVTTINDSLSGSGVSVSYNTAGGGLSFANATNKAISINPKDEASATILGLSKDGNTIAARTNDTAEPVKLSTSNVLLHTVKTEGSSVSGITKVTDLKDADGNSIAPGTKLQINGSEITITKTTTLSELATEIGKAGMAANYDANQGRFYLSAKGTGLDNSFDLNKKTNTDADGKVTYTQDDDTAKALSILGLSDGSTTIDAKDATIVYNNVEYTQASNSFSINGLNIEAVNTTTSEKDGVTVDNPITLTVGVDVDAIYNKVKDFVKAYNTLVDDLSNLYYADSAKGYEPLTDDEKDALSDDEVERWEKKIKDSILRKDSTIGSITSSMRTKFNGTAEYDGKNYSLASFGIVTGTYTEYGKLHIQGDSDDASYASYENKLKAAITENPDALMKTLSTIGSSVYSDLMTRMKTTTLSSALTFYNDKEMDNQIDDYDDEIDDMEDKLSDMEDRYYKQFTAMETAMSKLNNQTSQITSMLGGS